MLVSMDSPSENDARSGGADPAITVVIPCFNAGYRIRPVAEGAAARAARVIVVDDGSTDGAVDAMAVPGVEVLRLPHNRGKGHAILAGLGHALAQPAMEAVCLMDADGQHDPADIPGLVEAFRRERADLVIGQRRFDDGTVVPWRSRFGNQVTARVTRLLLSRDLPDTQCGFRVLSPRFARAVADRVAGGRYETEMEMIVLAVRGGFTLAHAPVRTVYEPGNRSSHFRKVSDSFRIYLRLAKTLLGRR
jgi:glycosyltransferase involved in cell wall biosynthesis